MFAINQRAKKALSASQKRNSDYEFSSADESDEEPESIIQPPGKRKKKRKHKKRKKSKKVHASDEFLGINFDDSEKEDKNLINNVDSLWAKVENEVVDSKILRSKHKKGRTKAEKSRNYWGKLLLEIRHFNASQIQKHLFDLKPTTEQDKQYVQQAIDTNKIAEKQKVLLYLVKQKFDEADQKTHNAKQFQEETNVAMHEELFPDDPNTRQYLKLLVHSETMTEEHKREHMRKRLYGDYLLSSHRNLFAHASTDYLSLQYNSTLRQAGFLDQAQYQEDVRFKQDLKKNVHLYPLKKPLSDPSNVEEAAAGKKNPRLKTQDIPYHKLVYATAQFSDIEKVFKSDYGSYLKYLKTDITKIVEKGCPSDIILPLIPATAVCMSQLIDTMEAEAKLKLDLKINIDGLTEDPQIRKQVSESLYLLRQLDNFKAHIFSNYVASHRKEDMSFNAAWGNMQRAKTFLKKYPVSKNTENDEREVYNEQTRKQTKPKIPTREQVAQNIMKKLIIQTEGKTIFNSNHFLRKEG